MNQDRYPKVRVNNFTFKKRYALFLFFVFCLEACMCTASVPGAHRSQKAEPDLLKLESQMVLSYFIGFMETNWVFHKSLELLIAKP